MPFLKHSWQQFAKNPIPKFLTVLAQSEDIWGQVIAEISRNWMPPASFKGAFLFGKSVCQKFWGYVWKWWLNSYSMSDGCFSFWMTIPHDFRLVLAKHVSNVFINNILSYHVKTSLSYFFKGDFVEKELEYLTISDNLYVKLWDKTLIKKAFR